MYEYLFAVFLILIIWIILYWIRKDTRKNMLFSSFLCMPLGFSDYIFIPSYWRVSTLLDLVPGIESFIFAFSIGGVAAVLYKIFHKKKLKKTKISVFAYVPVIPVYLVLLISFFSIRVGYYLIYTSSLAMFLGTFLIWIYRRDLIKSSVYGAIYFTLIYMAGILLFDSIISPGVIDRVWSFNSYFNIFILRVPIEEVFWSLSFSSLWSPIYEMMRGYKNV